LTKWNRIIYKKKLRIKCLRHETARMAILRALRQREHCQFVKTAGVEMRRSGNVNGAGPFLGEFLKLAG
jgi:hypothetical protein